jgi:signal transduction histidine kinase
VRDRGPGVPRGELEPAFEPVRTHRRHGTGRGLAIARRIVEAHGGSLTAKNLPLAEGGGAEVTARLPAVAPAPPSDQGT